MVEEDALLAVRKRNEFYRDSYRRVVAAFLLLVLINIVLACALLFVVRDKPAPRYFATTGNGEIVRLFHLSAPIVTTAELLEWAQEAALAANSYDFANYRRALQGASNYFTPRAWRQYQDALESSRNLEAVISAKLAVSATVTGAPVVLEQGVSNAGRYSWKVRVPLLLIYESSRRRITQPVEITMIITRVSSLGRSIGIAVNQIFSSEQPIR